MEDEGESKVTYLAWLVTVIEFFRRLNTFGRCLFKVELGGLERVGGDSQIKDRSALGNFRIIELWSGENVKSSCSCFLFDVFSRSFGFVLR